MDRMRECVNCLNAGRIWASTPQITDYHGFLGFLDIPYPRPIQDLSVF